MAEMLKKIRLLKAKYHEQIKEYRSLGYQKEYFNHYNSLEVDKLVKYKIIHFLKNQSATQELETMVNALVMAAYQDCRYEYQDIPVRRFMNLMQREIIIWALSKEQEEETLDILKNFYRVSSDINCLKNLDRLGRRFKTAGSIIFRYVTTLKEMEDLYKEKDVKLMPFLEGGDEFGILIYSGINACLSSQEVNKVLKLHQRNTEKIELSDLLEKDKVRNVFGYESISIKLSAASGHCTLSEALNKTSLESIEKSPDPIDIIAGIWFEISYQRCIANKLKFKQNKIKESYAYRILFTKDLSKIMDKLWWRSVGSNLNKASFKLGRLISSRKTVEE
jgi:hypothetical protein